MIAGQDEARFWCLSLREIKRILSAAAERRMHDANARMHHAWHVAAITRSKKMPKLAQLLEKPKPRQNRLTPEQIESVTRHWLASRHRKKR